MVAVCWSGLRNPATWYLAAGGVLLLVSLWLPYATAQRTTRVELRADAIARALIEAAAEPLGAIGADAIETVLARFHLYAEREGVYTWDIEVVDPPWPDTVIGLQNKHYLFHLAESPPDAKESPSPDATPNYEVMAWPRNALGPAHSVFFHPDNAVPAYTRNLAQGYAGAAEGRPQPGCAQRRQALYEWTKSYRGADDERWIAHRARDDG